MRFIISSLSLCFIGPLAATTVLLDFGTDASFRGVSVSSPDGNGNHWNGIRPGAFFSNLVDTAGVATTIDFGFDGSGGGIGTDSFNGPAGATSNPVTAGELAAVDIDSAALGALGVNEVAIDFVVATGGRFQIQGLDPTKTYDLDFFASRKFQTDAVTSYTIFDDALYSNQLGTTSLEVRDAASAWLHNRDTISGVSGLTPSGSGILYVEFTGTGGDSGVLNAMSITEVPEPSGVLMGSMVLLGFLRRRR